MQQISLVWILQKVWQVRHSLTPYHTSEKEAVKTNARWNPVTFCSKQQQAGWSTSSQARERRKISPPSSAPDFTHILCFTVNSETKTHFFLVKFLNSSSEYMDQKRQVFEFLIHGLLSMFDPRLQELISHDSLSNLVQSLFYHVYGSKNFNIELREVIFGCCVTNTYDDDTMSPDVDM